MTTRLGYQPGLDGLRAIAVLAVVAFHYGWGLAGGWLGVDLFFVISGYLITRLLVEEHDDHGRIALRAFYRRRAARLLPALLASVAVFATAGWVLRPGQRATDLRGAITGLLYVANLDRYLGLSDGGMFGHLWSLSLEEQFYAVWPVVFVLLARRSTDRTIGRSVAFGSGVLFLGVALRAWWAFDLDRLYNGIEGQGMAFLLAGCALGASHASHVSDASRSDRAHRAPGGGAVAAAVGPARLAGVGPAGRAAAVTVLLAAVLGADYWRASSFIVMPVLAMAMLVVIAASLRGGPFAAPLGGRALCWIGRRSYGIYLIHGPVRILLLSTVAADAVAISIVSFAITMGLAALSYTWLEQPLRRRLGPSRTAAAAAPVPSDVRV